MEHDGRERFFPGFETVSIDVRETTIFARRGGTGPPLLLLHGFPETHVMWHRVAPALTDAFTVVCADLRGYGRSGKPASQPDHRPYSKRSMALDMVRLMEALGFLHFSVAGHDRGGRVAYRMALDHPDRVARLAVLDIIPTSDAFRLADARFALAFWPWSLLTQAAPLPERLLGAAPDAVVDDAVQYWERRATCLQGQFVRPTSMHFVTLKASTRSAKSTVRPRRSMCSTRMRTRRPLLPGSECDRNSRRAPPVRSRCRLTCFVGELRCRNCDA